MQKAAGDKQVYIVAAGVCDALQAAGAGAAEDVAWVAPRAAKVTGNVERQKTAADPTKADVVVAAGRGFAAEEDLQKAATWLTSWAAPSPAPAL